MSLKLLLRSLPLLVLVAGPVMAAEPLAPRGEISVKGGTDRSLLTTEFWAPLAQQSDRVLYGDIRLMGDNDENREGNLGLGYRQIKNDAVLGVHGWIDRRRTQHNSTFHQLTFGVERLGHVIDARANMYIPINNGRKVITPNIGVTTPYLSGSGVFYDTIGSIFEMPQYGLDGELGYRIPVLQKQIDAIRFYSGGYYFFRDNTVEVPGARFRTEAQINKIFSIGARVQYDKPRGTQGFLEATLKFPFSAKRLYQESGIRSRLDESPERDVDIVTNSQVTDTGLRKPIIDTVLGVQQRILYVDNTKPDGGDGTYEKPFSNLKSAEAALQANDILYINQGDGTNRNMDQGLIVNKQNVQVIGSGTALSYGGYTFLNAGTAPVISNVQRTTSDITQSGIAITQGNSVVSGVKVTGAVHGILVQLENGTHADSVRVENVTVANNTLRGLWVFGKTGSSIDNVIVSNSTAMNNGNDGLRIGADGGSVFKRVTAAGNTTFSNGTSGLNSSASNGGVIENIAISGTTTTNNTQSGLRLTVTGNNSRIDTASITGNNTSGHALSGIFITVNNAATAVLNSLSIENNIANNNISNGIYAEAYGGGKINDLALRNNTANNNTGSDGFGINLSYFNNMIGNSVLLSGNTTNNNSRSGAQISVGAGAALTTATVLDHTARNNTQNGLYIAADTATINTVSVSNSTLENNSQQGLYLNSLGSPAQIQSASISDVKMNNNLQRGLYLRAGNSGSVLNARISGSDMTGNTLNGVFVQQATGATLVADFGNGTLSSTGQNRIFGNVGNDLNIDRATISAGSNWWNNAGAAPTRVTLTNGGSATYTTPLATNPRP